MRALRVLICDDSPAYTAALRRTLESEGDIAVPASCATGEEAIAALPRIDPDLVTMDVELPGMGGLRAVEEIMSSRPTPILMLSAFVRPGSDQAAAALAAGALDALTKDDLDLRDPASSTAVALRQRVRVLSRAHVIRHPRARLGSGSGPPGTPRGASVIGICASTGGPHTLATVLAALPADYPIPILVVQHMTAGFTEGLARWLGQTVPMPVGIAREGMWPGPGVWIAPEGAHLKLAPTGRLALDRHTVVGYHRPSGDLLLQSIAAVAGPAGVAVVLTGMGRDGAAGAAAVHASRGLAIAQDQQSSAMFGMPKAAIELGVPTAASPAGIAACLRRLHPEPLTASR